MALLRREITGQDIAGIVFWGFIGAIIAGTFVFLWLAQ
jgi:nitrogen fixation protein FixH